MEFIITQEKIDLLASNYKKLEENRKDYIRELTQKLVNIHCEGTQGYGCPSRPVMQDVLRDGNNARRGCL